MRWPIKLIAARSIWRASTIAIITKAIPPSRPRNCKNHPNSPVWMRRGGFFVRPQGILQWNIFKYAALSYFREDFPKVADVLTLSSARRKFFPEIFKIRSVFLFRGRFSEVSGLFNFSSAHKGLFCIIFPFALNASNALLKLNWYIAKKNAVAPPIIPSLFLQCLHPA